MVGLGTNGLILMFHKASFLVVRFTYNTIPAFLIMFFVILLSVLIVVLLCTKYDRTSNLCQQLKLASELESDLRHTVDLERNWLDFSADKTQLFSVDLFSNWCF